MQQQTMRIESPKRLTNNVCRDVARMLTSKSKLVGELLPNCLKALDTIIVLISIVASRKSTICQILDFVRQGSSSSITIESLAFDQFIKVLQEDI